MMPRTPVSPKIQKRVRAIAQFVLLIATLVGAFFLGTIATENPAVQGLMASGGYVGVFLFAFINGFNVFVPVLSASFVPALSAAGLNPYTVVFLISLGMTLADSVAFFLARIGRAQVSESGLAIARSIVRAEGKRHSFPLVILAIWSLIVPLPSELIVIPLALLGYRALEVIPIVIVGNFIFNVVIGFGLIDLFSLFGM